VSKQQERQETTEEYVTRFKAEQAEHETAERAKVDAALAEFDATVGARAQERAKAKQEEAERQEAERQARLQAEFDARHKGPARRAWLAQGGAAAEFERRWPEQAAQIRMTEATRQNEEARRAMERMVRNF